MRAALLIIVVFLASLSIQSRGQNGELVLKKKSTGREVVVREGRRLKVFSNNYKIKGKFTVVNDSVFAVGTDTLKLTEVDCVVLKSFPKMVTGAFATTVGGIILWDGVYFTASTSSGYLAPVAIAVGIPMIGLGGAITTVGGFVMLRGKRYWTEWWQLSIIMERPPS